LCFYLRFFTLVLLRAPFSEWALLGGVAGILLGWPVRTMVLALLSKPLGGHPHWGLLFSLSTWATLPLALRDVVQTIYMAFSHKVLMHPGLSGLVVEREGMALTGLEQVGQYLLGWVDLYTIWQLVLLVITVKVGAQVTTGKAILIVTIFGLLQLLVGSSIALL
jgi:hypothetical protein